MSRSATSREIERDFRNQNRVCAAGHARMQRNPARIAAHDFDDHDAAVRLGGRVQPIDGVGRERHGGVEAETVRRADDVVVDGLGDADERNAALVELMRDGERAVAADDDERVKSHLVEHLDDALGIVLGALPMSRSDRRTDCRDSMVPRMVPPSRRMPRDVARREHARAAGLDAGRRSCLRARRTRCRVEGGLDDGADDGIEAGSVAAAGEHADASRRTREGL